MAANGDRSLRKPVFVKVESLKPETNGHTLVAKVVNSNTVLQKGAAASAHLRDTRIAECLIGDETAVILFTARNEQGWGLKKSVFFVLVFGTESFTKTEVPRLLIGGGDYYEDNKNYWNSILNLVNSSPSDDSPVF
ncbi:hypothetical protein CASFOL_031813 [Castilleja foliolosa]|uniref:Single-stranded DNA binding protein Ssb-like OB fold domain-containing protein n=1 Tax=Castilleja foliolosa TaxID=1961234 RepID=A0ABD3C2G9_9LAMI